MKKDHLVKPRFIEKKSLLCVFCYLNVFCCFCFFFVYSLSLPTLYSILASKFPIKKRTAVDLD